jgi:hypothetical protein
VLTDRLVRDQPARNTSPNVQGRRSTPLGVGSSAVCMGVRPIAVSWLVSATGR